MASKKTLTVNELAGNTDVFGDLMNSGVSKKTAPVQAKVLEEKQAKPVHLTMLVKALPIVIPTARSIIFPRNANVLNSFNIFVLPFLFLLLLSYFFVVSVNIGFA